MQGTRRQILELLRVRGGQTVRELAGALRLTRTAVVSHLSGLQAEGLVAREGVRPGRRRPSALYVATGAADAVFPKTYAEFAASLLEEIEREGPETLSRVLARLGDRWVARDLPRVEGLRGRARLEMAQRILEERGFLPTLERSAGGYALREHNCPVMALAAAHPGICTVVHRWLEALAGVPLARARCMSRGDPFSEYVAEGAPRPAGH
jgi:DeoR family suf operon transcriptional repressor